MQVRGQPDPVGWAARLRRLRGREIAALGGPGEFRARQFRGIDKKNGDSVKAEPSPPATSGYDQTEESILVYDAHQDDSTGACFDSHAGL